MVLKRKTSYYWTCSYWNAKSEFPVLPDIVLASWRLLPSCWSVRSGFQVPLDIVAAIAGVVGSHIVLGKGFAALC